MVDLLQWPARRWAAALVAPVTWWPYPVLVVTASLGGLLSFFAVGCPVCNKLVVLALGTVGARRWFEPFQPARALLSIVLLVIALRSRLKSAASRLVPRHP